MRKIKYPLIVSDFDGTLVKEDGTVSLANRTAIAQYVADGGRFAISTGRMPAGILPQARELGLTGLVCCGQGAAIIDIQSGQPVSEGNISNEIAVAICKKMEKLGLHIHVYDLWDYYSNMDDEALAFYESKVKTKAVLVLDEPMSEFVKRKGMKPNKIIAMVEAAENDRLRAELAAEGFEGCYVTRSHEYLVELGNASYTKGTSIKILSERYGIDPKHTIAVGDQINDLPMIEAAGLGFAVKNADPALLAVATPLDRTNEEDAIARLIEKFAYTEESL